MDFRVKLESGKLSKSAMDRVQAGNQQLVAVELSAIDQKGNLIVTQSND